MERLTRRIPPPEIIDPVRDGQRPHASALPTLQQGLALTERVAQHLPERHPRFAVRWLRRLLEDDPELTIEEAAAAASALAALGGRSHKAAWATLWAMAERATKSSFHNEVLTRR